MVSAIYVHLPFCRSKCSYCDFVSYPGREDLIPDYVRAVSAELRLHEPLLDREAIATVYLGGGTPSLLSPASLRRLLGALLPHGRRGPVETTMEANPGAIDRARLDAFVETGGTRLSLGLQTHDRSLLELLGRRHTLDDAAAAVDLARQAGVGSINLDLIYGLPGQSRESWLQTLSFALSLHPDHVSAYCLELHPNTPLARAVGQGRLRLPEEEETAAMLRAAMTVLPAAGLRQYEVTNFARPGAECAHNMHYWLGGDYLGLGAAAHSHLGNRRWANLTDPASYLAAVFAGRRPVAEEEELGPREKLLETIMLGLRMRDGLALSTLAAQAGRPAAGLFGPALARLRAAGLLTSEQDRLRLTDSGVLLADYVVRELTAAIP